MNATIFNALRVWAKEFANLLADHGYTMADANGNARAIVADVTKHKPKTVGAMNRMLAAYEMPTFWR